MKDQRFRTQTAYFISLVLLMGLPGYYFYEAQSMGIEAPSIIWIMLAAISFMFLEYLTSSAYISRNVFHREHKLLPFLNKKIPLDLIGGYRVTDYNGKMIELFDKDGMRICRLFGLFNYEPFELWLRKNSVAM